MYRRREFLQGGLVAAGALTFGPAFWRDALAATPAQPTLGPYGPLQPPDANGLMLPKGFRSREIIRGGAPIGPRGYAWHFSSDGQATYATPDGGYILVSNSEVPLAVNVPNELPANTVAGGGASAIRFDRNGNIVDAYRILEGTQSNCAGGATPWGTWLSCEEHERGQVWECDPEGKKPAVAHPAMGIFSHEAAAVDPAGKRVYLTEDNSDSGFYRFTPASYPDLSRGLLEIAKAAPNGKVTWVPLPDPQAKTTPLRRQVPGSTKFKRGEGIWFDSGIVYVATTSDDRISAYDTRTGVLSVVYDGEQLAKEKKEVPLKDVDNITVNLRSGELFVCEDDGSEDPLDIGVITPDRQVARFLKLTGAQHRGQGDAASETTGVVFDPSGTRMYFASQRGFGVGVIYEVTGPFTSKRSGRRALRFRIRAARRVKIRTLRKRGLLVRTEASAPVTLDIALRVRVRPRSHRRRRGRGRHKTVTVARVRRATGPGVVKTRLRLTKRGRRLLTGKRTVRATLAVSARDAFGGRRRATQRVVLVGRRPRARR